LAGSEGQIQTVQGTPNGGEVTLAQMCVDECCVQRRMAKEALDDPDIRPGFEEVGGETVPQGAWCHSPG